MFDSVLQPTTKTAVEAENGELKEVIEEMQGKRDEEDIDIPEKKDANVMDIF